MLRQLLLLGGLSVLLMGCSYYQVSDPTSGKTYYTRAINDHFSGAISFQDARTGDDVTLQNHEVTKITKDQYEAGKRATVTVVPAPVPVPAGAVIVPATPGLNRSDTYAEPDDSDVNVPKR